ncbi:MAG: lysozyme inhibitor LprI family protein [Gallionella sp.]
MMRIVLITLGWLVLTLSVHAASFDCAKASTHIEKLICTNEELSVLDEKLSAVYGRNIADSENRTGMAKAQRSWLRDLRNTCDNSQCAIDMYEKRLLELENISGAYDALPDSKFISKLCQQLIKKTDRERIVKERDNVDDINNDGREEIVKTCWGGTMNTPCTDYFDQSGKRVFPKEMNYERKDWVLGAQSFRYLGRTFSLLYRDYELEKPLFLTYVTPRNEEYAICWFNTVVNSEVDDKSEGADGVCKAVIEKSYEIQPINLSSNSMLKLEKSSWKDAYVISSGLVDINNDGTQENIVELDYSNSGGRGCSFNFFDILDEGDIQNSSKEKRSNFLAMQKISESDFYIRGCGQITNRLFRYQNKTYYESNVMQKEGSRTISILSDEHTKTVCNFIRKIKVDGFEQVGSDPMNLDFELND